MNNNIRFDDYYYNRELSWIKFNQRVLEESYDKNNPLLERVKFLGIVTSNLDEFFMVRVASLKQQALLEYKTTDISGLTPKRQLKEISKAVHVQVDDIYRCWNDYIIPEMKEKGIRILESNDLNDEQKAFLEIYFTREIFPVLTPLAIDESRPFPFLLNESLNIGIFLTNENIITENEYKIAVVQVPSVFKRFIEIPCDEGKAYILLENIIRMYLSRLFEGSKIVSSALFRITRDADIPINEEDDEDMLLKIERWLKLRKKGSTIRLEIEENADDALLRFLKYSLGIHKGEIYNISGPLDLSFLIDFRNITKFKNLKYPPFQPVIPKELIGKDDIMEIIRGKDIFLHHPYDSFQPIVNLIIQASEDPNVLAIKQTLYRVSGNSSIIKALAKAAEEGKQVTVVVEIKARFDEEKNIQWAKKLEESGCHVVFGLKGLKIHSKMLLIVRREEDGIKRYLHLGTGNYNDTTAKQYTDMGLLTCDQYMASDASALFNILTGYSKQSRWYKLITSPQSLRKKFIELIKNEIKASQEGRKGLIIVKINSLADKEIIEWLYKASCNGVKIELIVRGICCLVPGVEGISDNIRVKSIVGRYLEHTRIFYFFNDNFPKIFLGSADWLPRNLDKRIETVFPIEDEAIKDEIIKILDITLKDNVKGRELNNDMKYEILKNEQEKEIDSQAIFQEKAIKNNINNLL